MPVTSPVGSMVNSNSTASSPASRSPLGIVPDLRMGDVVPPSKANVSGPAPHTRGCGFRPKPYAKRNATSTGDPSFAPGLNRHLRMHSTALSSTPYPADCTIWASRTLPSACTTSARVTSPCARSLRARSGYLARRSVNGRRRGDAVADLIRSVRPHRARRNRHIDLCTNHGSYRKSQKFFCAEHSEDKRSAICGSHSARRALIRRLRNTRAQAT
jgi:hypothetical protein